MRPPTPPSRAGFGLGEALRASLVGFRSSPTRQVLGTVLLLGSVLSVPLGVGLLLTPWALIYLISSQLGPQAHRQGWRTWLVLAYAGCLGLFSLLLAVLSADAESREMVLVRLALSGCVLLVLFVFFAPLRWVPWLLLDRRGNVCGFSSAGLRSVQMCQRERTQAGHVWAGAAVLAMLAPPLGIGMATAAYIAARDADTGNGPVREPGKWLLAWWFALVLSPGLVVMCLSATVVAPSTIPKGAQAGTVIQSTSAKAGETRVLYPPSTSLHVEVDTDAVRVLASDGGGVGRLPLPKHGDVESVVLRRVQYGFGVEVSQSMGVSHTTINSEGVRLDDDLTTRLASRVPELTRWALLLWWFGLSVGLRKALSRIANVGRGAPKVPMWWVLALTPVSVWAVWIGWRVAQ